MKSRSVILGDFDSENLSRFSGYFLSKRFTVLATNMRGFNAHILESYPISLAIMADPDELPGGRHLFDLLLRHESNFSILGMVSRVRIFAYVG